MPDVSLACAARFAPPQIAENSCFVGILGGMGPMAGATFAARLVALTNAATDQCHIPALLRNDPRIPDRSAARMHGGQDPFPALKHGVEQLERNQVSVIAIPCNTAHLWYDELVAVARVPILHIVDSVIEDLRRQGVHEGRIGLMGTRATLALGLYQPRLQAAGFSCETLNSGDMERYCIPAIEAVKSNDLAAAITPAAQAIHVLRQQGADAVVLGCTELPLAVPHALRDAQGIVLSDSIDALARSVINLYQDAP